MEDDELPVLDTVLGEISFFRSITRHRPVGFHRHFHVLCMQQAIQRETNTNVPVDDIWAKIEASYDLEALEGLEMDGYESTDSDASHPRSIPSPIPEENLNGHPHFRSEFELPWLEYDALMAPRRVSDTSPPPSPVSFPSIPRRKSQGKSKVPNSSSRRGSLLAGLVGGDSDSSALTESGDEPMDVDIGSAKQSRRNSIMTGTPTEGTMEDDDADVIGSPVTGARRGRGRPRGRPPLRKSVGGRRGARRRIRGYLSSLFKSRHPSRR
ncbi:chromatin modification-related protein EAF7-domain-containing protein [Hysterangium stoloniferum]|nr:chromatin modification-related protein EAF7-domain-containing protein [Hysterangium stoloniferum]